MPALNMAFSLCKIFVIQINYAGPITQQEDEADYLKFGLGRSFPPEYTITSISLNFVNFKQLLDCLEETKMISIRKIGVNVGDRKHANRIYYVLGKIVHPSNDDSYMITIHDFRFWWDASIS